MKETPLLQKKSHELEDLAFARYERERAYFEHMKKINDIFYDQVKISDQKAAYIFTFILAILVTSSDARGVFTMARYINGGVVSDIFSAGLAGFSTFSVLSAILAILPRHFDKSTSMFWGAWHEQRAAFRAAAEEGKADYLFNQYLDNADILSELARKKFRCVSAAFTGLIGTVVCYVGSLFFS